MLQSMGSQSQTRLSDQTMTTTTSCGGRHSRRWSQSWTAETVPSEDRVARSAADSSKLATGLQHQIPAMEGQKVSSMSSWGRGVSLWRPLLTASHSTSLQLREGRVWSWETQYIGNCQFFNNALKALNVMSWKLGGKTCNPPHRIIVKNSN